MPKQPITVHRICRPQRLNLSGGPAYVPVKRIYLTEMLYRQSEPRIGSLHTSTINTCTKTRNGFSNSFLCLLYYRCEPRIGSPHTSTINTCMKTRNGFSNSFLCLLYYRCEPRIGSPHTSTINTCMKTRNGFSNSFLCLLYYIISKNSIDNCKHFKKVV